MCICDPIQQKTILSTFEKIEIFVLSNWRFKKLSNDTKFIKIEGIVLKIQVLQFQKVMKMVNYTCLAIVLNACNYTKMDSNSCLESASFVATPIVFHWCSVTAMIYYIVLWSKSNTIKSSLFIFFIIKVEKNHSIE